MNDKELMELDAKVMAQSRAINEEFKEREMSLALIVGDTGGKLTVLDSYDTTSEAVKVARKLHRKLNGKTAMKKHSWDYTRVLVVPTLEIQ